MFLLILIPLIMKLNYIALTFLASLNLPGGNLAFKRKASQISVNHHCNTRCTAGKAVDGHDNGRSWSKCSYTNSEDNPWWRVDLGYLARIRMIQIVSLSDEERPYVIEVSNNTDVDSGLTPNEVMVDVGVDVIGRFIKVTRRENDIRISLCEVYVYGDCIEDMCGYDCKKTCHCQNATIQDKITGICTGGCKEGWSGLQCDKQTEGELDCERGWYGRQCSERCSDNCNGNDNRVCDSKDGKCLGGCKAGWRGEMCSKRCAVGSYGTNCEEKCSMHCKYGDKYCNRTTGHCRYGCTNGWTGQLCDDGCAAGTYGVDCKSNCSSNCKHGICHYVNGRCSSGCKPGYRDDMCFKKCRFGYYGDNCRQKCSNHCKGRYHFCRHIDGHCLNGCEPGWTGDQCNKVCEPGKFEEECKEKCPSNCKHDSCDYSNGTCTQGCKPGYQGSMCNEYCKVGSFGENCDTSCSKHCKGGIERCRNVDGQCLDGCQAGWNGTKCFSECDAGFYGENCTSVCGRCKSGTACNHVTGTCNGGCETGYTGNICLQEEKMQNAGSVSQNKEVPILKPTLIIIGIISVVLLLYAIVITVLLKRYRMQIARLERQLKGATNEAGIALSSDRVDETSHYTALSPQRTENTTYEAIQTEHELSA